MRSERDKRSAVRDLGVSTARGTLTYLVGNIVGSLAILLLLVLLARMLSPADFGVYAIAFAFFSILTNAYAFGVVLRQEIPGMRGSVEKARRLIGNTYPVALLVALAISVVAALLSGPIAVYVYHNPALAGTLALAASLVLVYTLFNLLLATLISVNRIKRATLMYLLYSFMQLFFSAALVLLGYGVFGAIAGLGIGLVVPSLLGLFWVGRHLSWRFSRPDRKGMRHVIHFSVPVTIARIANQAPLNLAVLLLGAFATTAIVGNYNAAFKFGNFVAVIVTSTAYVIMPAFARAFSERGLSRKIGRIYNGSIYYTLLLLLPLLVYAVSSAQPLFRLLFSAAYAEAPLYFALIAIGGTLGLLNAYASNLQVSYGDARKFMNYQLIAVAVQVALLFVLTPLFGAMGTILALFIISQLIIDAVYIHALRRQFKVHHSFSQVVGLAVPSAMLMAALYCVTLLLHGSLWALVVNLVATVILFPPLAALFRGIRKSNTGFIRDAIAGLGIGRAAKPSYWLLRYTELFATK